MIGFLHQKIFRFNHFFLAADSTTAHEEAQRLIDLYK
jgi:hypothetical protein